MKQILLPILFLSVTGCGTTTCLSLAKEDPKCEVIYGGVRTDINCVLASHRDWDNNWKSVNCFPAHPPEGLLKSLSVLDLPFSFAADTVMLPYAVWLTIKNSKRPQTEALEQEP